MAVVQSAYTITDIDQAIGEALRQMKTLDKGVSYLITGTDCSIRCTAVSITITLPSAADSSVWDGANKRGKDFKIMKKTALGGNIDVTADGVEVIRGYGSNTVTKSISTENDVLHIQSNGTDWDVI